MHCWPASPFSPIKKDETNNIALTSPMETLRRIRLAQAHQAIMQSDGSQSVSEIAARYGFSNAGRFANLYRRTFGEYPSDSVRNGIPRITPPAP